MRFVIFAVWGCALQYVLVAGRDIPRVALLFATNGPMPLEPVWRTLLEGVANVQVPELSEQDWAHLEESERIEGLRSTLLSKGELTANSIIQDADCMNNQMVRVRLSFITACVELSLVSQADNQIISIPICWDLLSTCDTIVKNRKAVATCTDLPAVQALHMNCFCKPLLISLLACAWFVQPCKCAQI
jgi:hypothetical protein